jgi:hypothetical protein
VTSGEPAGNLESGLAAALTGSARLAIVSGGLAAAAVVTAAVPMLWRCDARTDVPRDEPGAEPRPAAVG